MVVPGLKPEIFDALVAAKTPWECPWLTILKYATATAEHLSGAALLPCPLASAAQRNKGCQGGGGRQGVAERVCGCVG